jgi:hypothetical protein
MKIVSIIAVAFFCIVMFIAGGFSLIDGYNPVKPDIDTQFSSGYSEENFNKIAVGMDTSEVTRLIGEPLGRLPERDVPFKPMRFYSADGKCHFQSFAWLARGIIIGRDGKVRQIQKSVRYD